MCTVHEITWGYPHNANRHQHKFIAHVCGVMCHIRGLISEESGVNQDKPETCCKTGSGIFYVQSFLNSIQRVRRIFYYCYFIILYYILLFLEQHSYSYYLQLLYTIIIY